MKLITWIFKAILALSFSCIAGFYAVVAVACIVATFTVSEGVVMGGLILGLLYATLANWSVIIVDTALKRLEYER